MRAISKNNREDLGKFTPLLLLLFVGSGCSALIYEVVWFHLLRLVVGASAVSLAVLLGSFMGGMCLGSVGFSYVVSRRRHPIRLYAILELAVGVMGVLLLLYLPLVNRLYVASVGYGFGGVLLRGLACTVCLLPPTVCMGATLPAISRWMEHSRVGISQMGFFYGANIVGAVFGAVIGGLYLLRLYDVYVATFVAFSINVTVAALAFALASRSPYAGRLHEKEEAAVRPAYRGMYLVTALSGVTALGAEVIWTRQLSLLFGGTIYTFSLILAVYLAGLGLGSVVGSWVSRVVRDGRIALAACQSLLVITIPWAAVATIYVIPYMGVREYAQSLDELHFSRILLIDVIRCAIAILPSTFLWGASFPLALAAVGSRGKDPGRLVGGMYGANTVGAIVGAMVFSLGAIAALGTQGSQQFLTVLAALSAAVVLYSIFFSRAAGTEREGDEAAPSPKVSGPVRLASAAAVLVMTLLMVRLVPSTPVGLTAYGRHVDLWDSMDSVLYLEEGLNASVAVTELDDGERRFHVAGKVVASNGLNDMRIERMLGIVPAMLHPAPRSILVVGCGAGVTAGTLLMSPTVKRIVICEIEPAVIVGARDHFSKENFRVLKDARTEIVYDDGRHFLATTKEKFDIIASDPIHPWTRGVAALYSAEYYELCKAHLNPGGFVTQWMPLYETSEDAVKSGIATFMQAFPDGTLWNPELALGGYDLVMLGQVGPLKIDLEELGRRYKARPLLAAAMAEIGFLDHVMLMGTFAGQGPRLQTYMQDAAINRDRSLRLQYLAGAALDVDYRAAIHAEIVKDLKFPDNIFVGESD